LQHTPTHSNTLQHIADDVHMLKLYVPSDEEITTLRAYEGPVASLGIAERFFLEILDVHILKSLFRTTFTM